MKLGEAIARARQHLGELFGGQSIAVLGVDGIVFDDHLRVWTVTLAFTRPGETAGKEQKVIRIADADAGILSVA